MHLLCKPDPSVIAIDFIIDWISENIWSCLIWSAGIKVHFVWPEICLIWSAGIKLSFVGLSIPVASREINWNCFLPIAEK